MSSLGEEAKDWIVSIATAVVLALIIRTFIVELYLVDGPSMRPTLQSAERLVVNKFIYRLSRAVVCHPSIVMQLLEHGHILLE